MCKVVMVSKPLEDKVLRTKSKLTPITSITRFLEIERVFVIPMITSFSPPSTSIFIQSILDNSESATIESIEVEYQPRQMKLIDTDIDESGNIDNSGQLLLPVNRKKYPKDEGYWRAILEYYESRRNK